MHAGGVLQCSAFTAPLAARHVLRAGRSSPELPARQTPRRPRALPACAAGAGAVRGILTEPWDAAPQNWRRFWATKLAAAFVESDSVAETVSVRPVETAGLDWPKSTEEAQRRLRANATLFRQNYALCAVACLAAGAIRHTALLLALACVAAAAVLHSDRLLGELSLALDGQLAWNAKRVAGLDRGVLRTALPCVAVLCLALSPALGARWLVTSFSTAALLSLLHAVMRPVDLESVVGSFLGDIANSRTREDIGRSFNAAAQGLSGWWANRKATPAPGPVPIIVVQRQAGQPTTPRQPPQQPPPPPQKRLPGF